MHGLVGHRDMQRAGVGVGIDGDGAHAHPARRADDAAGDLAAIGDQDLGEHDLSVPSASTNSRRHAHVAARAHILNTPNLVSGTGAFSAAESDSASTSRVCAGSMMPSSHSRADE